MYRQQVRVPSADTVILQNCSINKKLSDSFVAVNFLL